MKGLNKIFTGAFSALMLMASAGSVNAETYFDYDGMYTVPDLGAFVVPSGVHAPTAGFDWKYTFVQPASNWNQNGFVDTAWTSGKGAFAKGGAELNDATTNITWPNANFDLWARSTFTLKDLTQKNMLMFWGRWDDNIQVYINGVLAADLFAKKWDGSNDLTKSYWTAEYRYLGLTAAARNALVVGTNKIAVYAHDSGGGAHLNLGIVKSPAMASLPINGYSKNSQFTAVINKAATQMSLYGVSAGSISIALDNGGTPDVFASAGIGYMKKDLSTPVTPSAVFRLASIDKSYARAAVRRMIEDDIYVATPGNGYAPITYDTPVFPVLNFYLGDAEFPLLNDSQKNSITIGEILNQTSGIYTDAHGNKGSALADLRWIYQQPLSNRGTYRYNNHAHFVLRELVQAVSQTFGYPNYNDYIRDVLLRNSDDHNYYTAWQDLSGRVSRTNGVLDEPWYTVGKSFWQSESGLGYYLAGSASADACSKYMIAVPGAEGWIGGMQGSSTFCWKSSYVDNSGRNRAYSLALFLNGPFAPEGQMIEIVESAIRNLPCTAWSASGTVCQ